MISVFISIAGFTITGAILCIVYILSIIADNITESNNLLKKISETLERNSKPPF